MRRNEQLKLLQRRISNLDRLTDRTKHLQSPSYTKASIFVDSFMFLSYLAVLLSLWCNLLHQSAFCSVFSSIDVFCSLVDWFATTLPIPSIFGWTEKCIILLSLRYIFSLELYLPLGWWGRELLSSICLLSVNGIIWFIFVCASCDDGNALPVWRVIHTRRHWCVTSFHFVFTIYP